MTRNTDLLQADHTMENIVTSTMLDQFNFWLLMVAPYRQFLQLALVCWRWHCNAINSQSPLLMSYKMMKGRHGTATVPPLVARLSQSIMLISYIMTKSEVCRCHNATFYYHTFLSRLYHYNIILISRKDYVNDNEWNHYGNQKIESRD